MEKEKDLKKVESKDVAADFKKFSEMNYDEINSLQKVDVMFFKPGAKQTIKGFRNYKAQLKFNKYLTKDILTVTQVHFSRICEAKKLDPDFVSTGIATKGAIRIVKGKRTDGSDYYKYYLYIAKHVTFNDFLNDDEIYFVAKDFKIEERPDLVIETEDDLIGD